MKALEGKEMTQYSCMKLSEIKLLKNDNKNYQR